MRRLIIVGLVLAPGLNPGMMHGQPAMPDSLDYLRMAPAAQTDRLAGKYKLGDWRDPDFDVFDNYERFRKELLGIVQDKAGLPAGVSIADLPEPALNRMALTMLSRQANLFRFPGEELAFMAKYAMDGGLARWIILGGAEESQIQEAMKARPKRGQRWAMNCAQFVQYSARLAGLPEDPTVRAPAVPREFRLMVDSHLIGLGPWRGWWMASANPVSGPHPYRAIAIMPGDLVALYAFKQGKNGVFEFKKDWGWEFVHVEVITREDYKDDNNTASIGNSGKGPHYSDLLGKMTRLGQWVEEAFRHTGFFSKETVKEWRHVIYRFDHLRGIPEKLDLSPLLRQASGPEKPGDEKAHEVPAQLPVQFKKLDLSTPKEW